MFHSKTTHEAVCIYIVYIVPTDLFDLVDQRSASTHCNLVDPLNTKKKTWCFCSFKKLKVYPTTCPDFFSKKLHLRDTVKAYNKQFCSLYVP